MPLRLLPLLVCLATFTACTAQQDKSPKEEISTNEASSPYTFKTPSPDGTGKYYMGREISHVMGHLAANWLERPEREREENVSQAIENMDIQPDERIADIGAGSGYYTFRMARKVPQGKVFAVDIQPEMLDILNERIEREDIENVAPIQGSETSPNLEANSVDLVTMVDVYHELSHPREMMQDIVTALRPGGRFVLLEYRMEDSTVPIKRLHKLSEAQAVREMASVGLRLQENIDNLPWQHCMVFVKE
ncbi:2-methoxy-6-polyprenyl-1,4-benzoquinol methylase, mitochondrial [Neolewinella maritima]|uniref:2-methoxy-6-polyprenyl-1,4-benzoquinol methylase, mitochondrial n=1 Tax=Neolewinella maritima TaxID=1383882 RepID=A0ABN8F1V7_9BACT|nr:class I SAM-dependent methyltransferase [Neolewinella maritima]CAH0998729.1 2-methoxy-6-polyprenyl-1,4-benzoquinol methylase, mitochondrial [Neolewinella maritima]